MNAAPRMLAEQDYPLLNLFWTMLWLFLWILWIFLLIRTISDVFRSDDLSGWGKALWTVFIIVLPYLGVLIYLIARGTGMQGRDVRAAQDADQVARSYIRSAAGTSASAADEVTKLANLRDQGVITESEFADQKAKVLA
jgi:hypothetical protein